MQDTKVHTALLTLLKWGLWEDKELSTGISLSSQEWVQLYRLARNHTVEGVVFDGIQCLEKDRMPPRELLLRWTVRLDQIERHNKQMNERIQEQLTLFRKENLSPVLLKGQGVAAHYPCPSHRICGDVDWYFKGKEYKKANALIENKGLQVAFVAGFSTEYNFKGIVIEHHKRMFDIHNPFCFSFLKSLQKYNKPVSMDLEGGSLLVPTPKLMILQVNAHILKHQMSFGLGIRQLCDAARLYYVYRNELDGNELKRIYEKLGIGRWIHLLHYVLVKFIGLPKEFLPFELPTEINADWMMDEIWRAGNFGFFDSRFEKGEGPSAKRTDRAQRIGSNVRTYFKYAPGEALCFPLVHFYSKYVGK